MNLNERELQWLESTSISSLVYDKSQATGTGKFFFFSTNLPNGAIAKGIIIKSHFIRKRERKLEITKWVHLKKSFWTGKGKNINDFECKQEE